MEDRCPSCKKPIPKESQFCVHCGKQIVLRKPILATDENLATKGKESKNRLVTIFNILTFLAALICIGWFIYYYLENKINMPADKNPLNEEIIDNLYRNTKYKFRIRFPNQWHIQKGDGPNILVKASNGEGSSININVKDQGMTLGDIDELFSIDEWANSITDKFPDAKFLEKKQVFVDNKRAFLVKYSLKYKTLDKQVDGILYTVALTNSNFMYTITAGSPASQFNQQQSILDQSIMTFVLEDYSEKTAIPNLDKFIEDLVRKGATDEEIKLQVTIPHYSVPPVPEQSVPRIPG